MGRSHSDALVVFGVTGDLAQTRVTGFGTTSATAGKWKSPTRSSLQVAAGVFPPLRRRPNGEACAVEFLRAVIVATRTPRRSVGLTGGSTAINRFQA
jgi:hypothetical protein